MAGEQFLFDSRLVFSTNGDQFVREIRGVFAQLRAEAKATIAAGTTAGIQPTYQAAIGQAAAAVSARRAAGGLTDRQLAQSNTAIAAAQRAYETLARDASNAGLTLRKLSQAGIDTQFTAGTRLLNEALQRQASAKTREAAETERLAQAEAKAAAQEEKRAAAAASQGEGAVPSSRYTVGGLGETRARMDAINARFVQDQERALAAQRYTVGGRGVAPGEIERINKNLAGYAQQSAINEQIRAETIRADTAREQANSTEWRQARAQSIIEERRRSAALSQEVRQQAAAQGLSGGTFFQRVQAVIAQRSGGGGDSTRLPQDFQSFGQFFLSKAITTGGFALSGGLLYGAITGFKQIEKEASALQRELSIVKSQFDEIGDTRGFDDFTRKIVDISTETGVMANDVANVARQLAGVFRDDNTGLPDFQRALAETENALKLSQVSGLPLQEITDSLTAITSTYDVSFKRIGDAAIGLEQRFGVLAPEIIKFTADLAPTAKELGFTVEQIAALGAIAQQRSGIAGGSLAESFNRALPAIQGSQVAIAQLLAQRPQTQGLIDPILQALGQGQGAKVLSGLTEAYGKMTEAQRNALAELLGGQRNAKAFFAVLQGGQQTIDALNNADPGQFAGKLDARFHDFQETVSFAFEKVGRELEKFGLALFNSGIADGLKLIADTAGSVLEVITQLLGMFTSFNDAAGGIPAKLLAIYAALRLISALRGGVGAAGGLIAGITGGAIPGGAAAVEAPAAAGALVPGPGGGFIPAAEAAATTSAVVAAPLFSSRFATSVKSRLGGATAAATEAGTAAPSAVGAAGVRGVLAGAVETLAPLVAVLAVSQLVQTVSEVRKQTADARQFLEQQIQQRLAQGADPNEILRQADATGGHENQSYVTQLVNFGQQTNTFDASVDAIQKANAERQGKELQAIADGLDEQTTKKIEDLIKKNPAAAARYEVGPQAQAGTFNRGDLDRVIQQFLSDPAFNQGNDLVAQIIDASKHSSNPLVVQKLKEISDDYAKQAAGANSAKQASDYTPVLEEVRARYESGDASFASLVDADKHQIDVLKQAVRDITDPTQRTQAAQKLAQAERQFDQDLDTETQRVADLTTRIAGIQGRNVAHATSQAKLEALRTKLAQGAGPDSLLTSALDEIDAQQTELQKFINSPVVKNGIARDPTAQEKLDRALQGVPIPPEVRDTVIKSQLSRGGNLAVINALAAAKGESADKLINEVTQAIESGDHTIVAGLQAAARAELHSLLNFIQFLFRLAKNPFIRGAVEQEIKKALEVAQSLLSGLQSIGQVQDPGAQALGDVSDLKDQAAVEASTEARALADALVAQDRARAHGDPILEAQAAIKAAQVALFSASKPSERAAAIAQLIDAQNQLEDANSAIIDAYIDLGSALSSDPVLKARYELSKAQHAVDVAHGTAAKYAALAQQANAQRNLDAAIADIFQSQQELVAALATAAGDTVGAAQDQLVAAQAQLQGLLNRQAAGDNPGDAAINRARAQVVQAQANVRDTQLRQRESDIDIALQLERITTQQAIAQFQALLQIPNLTAEETNQILLKIRQLQNDLGRDLQFNIPNEIKLPTIYQVRRLEQQGAASTPLGPGSFQDNRQIVLFPNAVVNASSPAEVDAVVAKVAEAIGGPPRNGERYGNY